MASINFEFFDIIGELILMKEESKEDEEHVRGLLENFIKCLDENKIVLRLQLLEGIRHLNIKKLLDY
ncbi:unnamed protein product [Brassica oleracea]